MSSPASTGPAGAYFEAQVGAHYLLTMLIGAEPRGLRGKTRRHAIVHAHDRQGNHAVLEIQAKLSVTFAPSDREFCEVVGHVARASQNPRVPVGRHKLAVAISRSSRKIDGPYQQVLTWARRLESHETFFCRISRAGSANADMRTFVSTFQANLRKSGCPDDQETVWRLLWRFQILPFDYTAPGSALDAWDKERAAGALHPDDAHYDGWSQPPQCYLSPDRFDRVDPLLPALQRLAISGPCFFVALNLIEVAPRPNHLGFIVAVAESWLKAYPDNSDLWRDQLIGRRICGLIDSIRDQCPSMSGGDEDLTKTD